MNKVLICNAVMANNGDAALVLNLADAISAKGYDVLIATHNFEFAKKTYPNYNFCPDVLSYVKRGPKNIFALISIWSALKINENYKSSELIISAPGGYLNSYYGFFLKLFVLVLMKLNKKRVIIYSQSVGPLTNVDKYVLKAGMKYIDLLLVRDDLSLKNAIDAGVHKNKLLRTEDAIFLQKIYKTSNRNDNEKKVAISVREWKFDGRDRDSYISAISAVVEYLVGLGYKVDFLSTCQGVTDYIDDSVIAVDIVNQVSLEKRRNVCIISNFLPVETMQKKIRDYRFIIGTRLHMCLLGFLNNVPAFNISYENKGKEAYEYLDLMKYSVDYNSSEDSLIKSLSIFINDIDVIHSMTTVKIEQLHVLSKDYLNKAIGGEVC